jgi:hypothetical protein
MGQLLLSAMVAIAAAAVSVMSGNGVLVTLLIYSTAGSMSLLTLAMMVYVGCSVRSDERD